MNQKQQEERAQKFSKMQVDFLIFLLHAKCNSWLCTNMNAGNEFAFFVVISF